MVQGNPFVEYLESHPNAGLEALKQLYRILAKRTHPDLGAANHEAFIRLQDAYHHAVGQVLARAVEGSTDGPGSPGFDHAQDGTGIPVEGQTGPERSPREAFLNQLYRYRAHLPAYELQAGSPQKLALDAFNRAMAAAQIYDASAYGALKQFHDQFHLRRQTIARYPDVRTKYIQFVRGLASAFDYLSMPNDFNLRLAFSYLDGVRMVSDYDPTTSPELRNNRSAPARAALYRMKVVMEDEIKKGPCDFL